MEGQIIGYYRLLLMVKSGVIGEVVSVDSICTSQTNLKMSKSENFPYIWNSMSEWGATAMLPIFQLMGTDYKEKIITTRIQEGTDDFDLFTKIAFIYPHGVASMKIGQGVKSEGELIMRFVMRILQIINVISISWKVKVSVMR